MLPFRIRLFASHLAISAAIIFSCVAFVVFVWYPPPLASLEGVYSILFVMAGVDVCAGPLCTLIAASPGKSRTELKRDLSVIGALQIVALCYALYTTGMARPAYIVYSLGQFEVEHANELPRDELEKAAGTAFAKPPLSGPEFAEARYPDDPQEAARIVNSAITTGVDIKDMPRYFQAWPYQATDAREKAVAATALPEGKPLALAVARILEQKSVARSDAILLPIDGKIDRGTVVLRKSDLVVLGIVPFLTPPTANVTAPARRPDEKAPAAQKNSLLRLDDQA
jgi:hypothetical protein